jgi:hypothetical protein
MLADVPVSAATSALLSLGLEMLANEVRRYKAVPMPHLPTHPLAAEGSAGSGASEIAPVEIPKGRVFPTSDGW